MKRTLWTERIFSFDVPAGWLPNVLERLRGTYPRLVALTDQLSDDVLSFKENDSWSIKEHIGHLADLEALHEGRVNDCMERKEDLRPADMSNQETEKAHHNDIDLESLLGSFREKREHFIASLLALDEDIHHHTAMHPRLHILMRPIDVAQFAAEHDDHHLASIRGIVEKRVGKGL